VGKQRGAMARQHGVNRCSRRSGRVQRPYPRPVSRPRLIVGGGVVRVGGVLLVVRGVVRTGGGVRWCW